MARNKERGAIVASRAAAPRKLYRIHALFVADNFGHVHLEETENHAVLWTTYTDDELRAIERAIVASHAAEQIALVLRRPSARR